MMEETGIKDSVIDEIRDLAKKCGVGKVILFGSRARGDYKRASDIDLAAGGGDVFRFALAVDEETSTPLRFDIINLDEKICEELWEAVRTEGRILYEKI